MSADWAALCEICEWERTMPSEKEAKVVTVLHVLVRHPDKYLEATGKDPGPAMFFYAEQINAYRKDL